MRNTDAPIQLLAHTSTFLGPWRKRALLSTALDKKSWAVIDRPYSLGCATVGALYERPRCIFCAKPTRKDCCFSAPQTRAPRERSVARGALTLPRDEEYNLVIAKRFFEIQKGGSRMCDYSLHGIPNRLAEKDEVLEVHRFYTGSKGLTSPEYLKPPEQSKKGLLSTLTQFLAFPAQPRVCAVCIPDGA